MQLYRVLFAWEGGNRPYAPSTILELDPDDPMTGARVSMSALEPIDEAIAVQYYGWTGSVDAGAGDVPATELEARLDELGGLLNRNVTSVEAYVETAKESDLTILEDLEGKRARPRVGVTRAIAARRGVLHLEAVAPLVRAMQERDRLRAEADEGREPPDYLESLERDALVEAALLFGVPVAEGFDFENTDQRAELLALIAEAAAAAVEELERIAVDGAPPSP